MPYYTKGVTVPATRRGSDAWLNRSTARWSPIADALAAAGPGETPALEDVDLRLELFEQTMGEVPGAVCGSRCWHAASATCSCSCAGKNHGRDR